MQEVSKQAIVIYAESHVIIERSGPYSVERSSVSSVSSVSLVSLVSSAVRVEY